MKTKRLMIILTAVLLFAMLAATAVFADDEHYTNTLKVPTDSGQKDVTASSVSVTGPKEPGILMTAENQPISVMIDGNVDGRYGGIDMETIGSGQISMKAGGVRGGFGVLSYINGGQITGTVDSITASGDTALEAVLSRSGSLTFTANSITSTANAITLATGVDFSDHIVDPGDIDDPEDPGNDDWDVIDDEEYSDSLFSSENDFAGKSIEETLSSNSSGKAEKNIIDAPIMVKADGGTGDVVLTAGSIDAGGTAVDIMLNDARTVSLTADDITSEGSAVLIELSEEGGDVTLNAPSIDAGEQGIMIQAPNGSVTVNNEDYLSAESAVEVFNNGADVTLNSGFIYSNSGLFVESTAGTTVENTEDIAADNYGIYVRTHLPSAEQTFDPYADAAAEPESAGISKEIPSVTITVDGDISDDYTFEEQSEEYNLPPEESEAKGIAKDGEDEAEEENNETSVGVVVEADTTGTVDISVLGEVYMAYGNEINAGNGAEVNVTIRDNVTTTYGNRLSADDAKVTFSVGESVNAGGKGLDTLVSNNGSLEITIGKGINVTDSGNEEETAGIYANSMENGSTQITVGGGINVISENTETPVYGVFAENTGGEITIEAADDVFANGNDSVGAVILNGSDSAYSEMVGENEIPETKTVLKIMGNLSGDSVGLYVDGSESTIAEVFVEGAVSGDDAGVEISDEVIPDNLDLKVWMIGLNAGNAVRGGTNAEEVQKNINYLIKYSDDDLSDRLEVVDENGELLPDAHGYPYAKDGAKIYFRTFDEDIHALYNGNNALTKEADGRFSLIIPTGGGILISESAAPVPVNPPRPAIDMYWLYDRELPGTGFSATHMTPLAARPQGLNYRKTGLTLQIPGLDVEEEIVKVPETDGSYHIEWLESSIGLLDQSSLPGKGITVLTGHNHLNSTEAGPFLFIGRMEAGDRIMITDAGNNARIYKVYGNYKIASNGFSSVANELRQNALVLITCEDEAMDGGYLNRRVILAEPLTN